jgi:hypothetical protein
VGVDWALAAAAKARTVRRRRAFIGWFLRCDVAVRSSEFCTGER